MMREVTLPAGVQGRLLLHSIPGLWEEFDAFLDEAAHQRLTLVVRLTDDEETRISSPEYADALEHGLVPFELLSCDMPDHGVPDDRPAFRGLAHEVSRRLHRGEAVLVHCYAGIGRTGTFAAAVLVALGVPVRSALGAVYDAGSGPGSGQQEALIDWCASQAAGGD